MNAGQWYCNLRPSRQARRLQQLFCAATLLVLATMPIGWPVKIALLLFVLREHTRQCQRLAMRQGALRRERNGVWYWQGTGWRLVRPILWLPDAALLCWQSEPGQRQRFWLRQDMMSCREWRQLRARLFIQSDADK